MDSIKLVDLKKRIFKRSAILGIPDISDILSIHDEISGDEVFGSLVRDALVAYEYYDPLVLTIKYYLVVDGNKTAEIVDNFQSFLDGIISEDQVSLVPNGIIGLSSSNYATQATSLYKKFDYQAPLIQELLINSGLYYIRGVFNRPYIEDYDSKGVFTDKSAIYWMKENRSVRYTKFYDQVYVKLLKYIINLKSALQLPNLPVDIFNNVETEFNEVNSSLENYYNTALNFSKIVQ